MLRAIRQIQPRWVVGENVRGIINWNGGLVFEEVQADLEAEGYEVQPFVLPAAGVNAPHRRDRVWFVAYSDCNGYKHRGFGEDRRSERQGKREKHERERIWADAFRIGTTTNAAYTHRKGFLQREQGREQTDSSENTRGLYNRTERLGYDGTPTDSYGKFGRKGRMPAQGQQTPKRHPGPQHTSQSRHWENFPTQPPVYPGDDGVRSQLVRSYVIENSGNILTEKEIDAIVSKTLAKHIEEAIKASGNAIVPQVALQIFKAIQQYQDLQKSQ